jgi:hypothetical protein
LIRPAARALGADAVELVLRAKEMIRIAIDLLSECAGHGALVARAPTIAGQEHSLQGGWRVALGLGALLCACLRRPCQVVQPQSQGPHRNGLQRRMPKTFGYPRAPNRMIISAYPIPRNPEAATRWTGGPNAGFGHSDCRRSGRGAPKGHRNSAGLGWRRSSPQSVCSVDCLATSTARPREFLRPYEFRMRV